MDNSEIQSQIEELTNREINFIKLEGCFEDQHKRVNVYKIRTTTPIEIVPTIIPYQLNELMVQEKKKVVPQLLPEASKEIDYWFIESHHTRRLSLWEPMDVIRPFLIPGDIAKDGRDGYEIYKNYVGVKEDYCCACSNNSSCLYTYTYLKSITVTAKGGFSFEQGCSMLNQNKYYKQLEKWDHFLQIKPTEPAFHYQRAKVLVDMRNLEGAVRSLDKAIHFSAPDDTKVLPFARENREMVMVELRKIQVEVDIPDDA